MLRQRRVFGLPFWLFLLALLPSMALSLGGEWALRSQRQAHHSLLAQSLAEERALRLGLYLSELESLLREVSENQLVLAFLMSAEAPSPERSFDAERELARTLGSARLTAQLRSVEVYDRQARRVAVGRLGPAESLAQVQQSIQQGLRLTRCQWSDFLTWDEEPTVEARLAIIDRRGEPIGLARLSLRIDFFQLLFEPEPIDLSIALRDSRGQGLGARGRRLPPTPQSTSLVALPLRQAPWTLELTASSVSNANLRDFRLFAALISTTAFCALILLALNLWHSWLQPLLQARKLLDSKSDDPLSFEALTRTPIAKPLRQLFRALIETKTQVLELSNEARRSQQRYDEAEAANKAKSDFLATVSHEIRTPLNGLIGMLEALANEELGPNQRDMLATARRSSEILMLVLDDVLDFSKIRAGKLHIEERPFLLSDSLRAVLDLAAPRARERGIELRFDNPLDIPDLVLGDSLRLRQILNNLIGNALKFTSEGFVRLAVAMRERQSDQLVLRFEIEDSGIGIPPDRLAQVFEQYSQAERSTTRRFGGTGLGLAICKSLAELMGGRVEVQSEAGLGTTFIVDLPFRLSPGEPSIDLSQALLGRKIRVSAPRSLKARCEAAILAAGGQLSETEADLQLVNSESAILPSLPTLFLLELGQSTPQEMNTLPAPIWSRDLVRAIADFGRSDPDQRLPSPSGTQGRFEGSRVLLVDDNAVNLKVASLMLTRMGCEVSSAKDGEDAVAQARAGHFDLILMDCQMPVLDGFEATRRLRREFDSKTLPIVALTADISEGVVERCLAAGMNAYLRKPVIPKALREVLADWLKAS